MYFPRFDETVLQIVFRLGLIAFCNLDILVAYGNNLCFPLGYNPWTIER